ncbi:helix-turn-helix domain-containing protein [Streptomyces sp. NPDC059567]|uniref:helix-turn-helix domain-containing protein n=1 Tax=Streptomyces sp. NPDC059567 TaxID=3346867 RepID=UPI0036A742D0
MNASGLRRADDDLARLHLLRGAPIGRLLGRRVLDAFDGLPDGRAARLAEALDALLTSWGRTASEVAHSLGIHPQTARQRLRRLDALFGRPPGRPPLPLRGTARAAHPSPGAGRG